MVCKGYVSMVQCVGNIQLLMQPTVSVCFIRPRLSDEKESNNTLNGSWY